MNSRIKFRFLAGALAMVIIVSCSDSDDPSLNPNQNPNNNNPVGGAVTITSVPNGVFWGDELTITGTGFSTVKEENLVKFTKLPPLTCSMQYTSAAGGAIEIISASATQLKIKVPLRLFEGNPVCGPHKADIEVTVMDKTGKFEGVTFGPLPYVGNFAYHYGWFDVPKVTRIGDSVMLSGGLLATGPKDSEYWDDVRLSIDGAPVEIKFRSIALESGWAFFLPAKKYASTTNCSDEPDGWGAREMDFTFSIAGTNKKATRKLYVKNWPEVNAACFDCPALVSLSGQQKTWTIHGKDMFYTDVRFVPLNATNTPAQNLGISPPPFTEEISFEIPFSVLTADNQYAVYLANECFSTNVGTVTLTP